MDRNNIASKTPIKGSILDIQIGKHPTNSPIPSPKPFVVVSPPHSPLRHIVKRANDLIQSLSNSTSCSADGVISQDGNSLSSSNSLRPMLVILWLFY